MKQFSSEEIKNFISKRIFFNNRSEEVLPKISIITPSFNQGRYLERTILSVLNQGYPNLEYIIIDGGSTDESVQIIKKYEKYIAYWVSEKDNGQAHALNKGFKLATGELVGWQNADDIYLPNALQKVALAYQRTGADVIFGNIYLIDVKDNIIKELRYVPFNLDHLIYYDWNLSSQAVFWRYELFNRVGFLKNYPVLFDWDWFVRVGLNSQKFSFVREFLGCYRLHPESKFSLIQGEKRKFLFLKLLQENGVSVSVKKDWQKQYRLKKLKAFWRKFFWYLLQGDADYILKGAYRRVRYRK